MVPSAVCSDDDPNLLLILQWPQNAGTPKVVSHVLERASVFGVVSDQKEHYDRGSQNAATPRDINIAGSRVDDCHGI